MDGLATRNSGKKPIHPQYVARVLDQIAAEDALLRRGHRHHLGGPLPYDEWQTENPRFVHAWIDDQRIAPGHRCAGQLSRPRQVVSMSGDGGLAMLMGELLTLRQHELQVKLIVFKNDSLAFVEPEMRAAGILDFATSLRSPNFAKVAEGAGLLGLTAEIPDQVAPTITQALQYGGPALVEVPVSRQELSILQQSRMKRRQRLQPLHAENRF